MSSAALKELCSEEENRFLSLIEYSTPLNIRPQMPKKKEHCKENKEWRAHLSDVEYMSLSLEPKQERALGASPDASIMDQNGSSR